MLSIQHRPPQHVCKWSSCWRFCSGKPRLPLPSNQIWDFSLLNCCVDNEKEILPSLSSLRSTRFTWHTSWRIRIHPDKGDVRGNNVSPGNNTSRFTFFELCVAYKNLISDIQLYCSCFTYRKETTSITYGTAGSAMRVVFLLNRLVAVKS